MGVTRSMPLWVVQECFLGSGLALSRAEAVVPYDEDGECTREGVEYSDVEVRFRYGRDSVGMPNVLSSRSVDFRSELSSYNDNSEKVVDRGRRMVGDRRGTMVVRG